MTRTFSGKGFVLYKKNLLKDDKLISIFSDNFGKITCFAKGIRKITSKRLSHLETGNFIKFTISKRGEFNYLQESEVMWGFSKIKSNPEKLEKLYTVLFILEKILPQDEKEIIVLDKLQLFLKKLNNSLENFNNLDSFLIEILIQLGYLSKDESQKPYFDSIKFTESIIGQKIKI